MEIANLELSSELWKLVASFLGFADVVSMTGVCLSLHQYLNDNNFWEAYLKDKLLGFEIGALRIVSPRSIMKAVFQSIQSKRLFNALVAVAEVSSLDRSEEGPANTLKPSNCLRLLDILQGSSDNTFSSAVAPSRLGEFAQSSCGCIGTGRVCYWSSGPSTQQSGIEHVTYRLKPGVSFFVGFSVTPYQAYMHPGAPVYGPLEVCLQLVDWTAADAPAAVGGTSSFTTGRKTLGELLRGVYYQSDVFPVQNEFREQFFMFDRPVLCDRGVARLVFRGMHQRQRIGMGLPEDYYLCISHCTVLAAAVGDELGEISIVRPTVETGSAIPRMVWSGPDGGRADNVYGLSERGEDFRVCPVFVSQHAPTESQRVYGNTKAGCVVH